MKQTAHLLSRQPPALAFNRQHAPRIDTLIVGMHDELGQQIKEFLLAHSFEIQPTNSATGGIATDSNTGVVLVDLDQHDVDAFELIRCLREQGQIPIIAIGRKNDEIDRILALELGADDYLAVPFPMRELLARLRAVFRRVHYAHEPVARADTLVSGELRLVRSSRRAYLNGRAIALTSAEFRLLEKLLLARGDVVPRTELAEYALGRELMPNDRCVDTHICRLRRKLGPMPGGDPRIQSVRGQGYLMPEVSDAQPEAEALTG